MSAPDANELERVARGREAVLLLKFLSGLLLATPEMAELRGVLPADVLANPPDPQPDYRHPYAYYAKALNCGERNIKRLVAAGRPAQRGAPPDFPPFDDKALFLSWWRRHMGRDPGAHVLAFVGAAAASAAPSDASPAGPDAAEKKPTADPKGAPPTPTAPPMPFEFVGVGGFEGSVRELRSTVAAAQKRLRDAMMATPLNESLVASCNRTVREQLDLLRKSENDLFDFQQKRGELVPKSEIREDWRTLLSALRRMRERMENNIATALAVTTQFSPEQIALVKTAVGAERAREDQLLRTSKFWRRGSDNVSPEPAVS